MARITKRERQGPNADGEAVIAALRAGEDVGDRDFDRLIPQDARAFSRTHWSSVEVARRAAALLVDRPGTRVLDLGSGVGKFCIVGSLTTPGHFTGIERNGGLLQTAKAIVKAYKLTNIKFLGGDIFDIDWDQWQAYYLFNPFASNFEHAAHGVRAHAASDEHHASFAATCRRRLEVAPIGAKVVLYWGYGASMPPGWERTSLEYIGSEPLELWIKV